ncbi:hypothetical protein [Variovorax boronicumulans]|uniref:hypothetical protein n=1 Tax=Variovorax boronicumulans TaxID=436515 RepID=UPI0012E4F844|nr:hypothetical protein [Variovorax boronicumulans]GER09759.1 hypothetical protein VHAB30_09120 [Variovorax boronicumulans]
MTANEHSAPKSMLYEGHPMKTAGRLALGVLAWAASIPLTGFLGIWLYQSVLFPPELAIFFVRLFAGMLILAAALIYWRCVPSAPDWGRRMIYLVGFALLLTGVGYLATYAGVALVVLLLWS